MMLARWGGDAIHAASTLPAVDAVGADEDVLAERVVAVEVGRSR